MNDLVVNRMKGIAKFKPQEAKNAIADAEMIVERAARLREWAQLSEAVQFIMDVQEEIVGWWQQRVTVRQSPGRSGNKSSADRGAISVADAEKQTGITHQQISKWAARLKDKLAYSVALYGAAWKKAMAVKGQTDQRGASGTGENEWYTPDEYLDAARAVLGEIDLDPASSDAAQEKVQATKYFTKETNGLTRDWEGRVWLNPPYAQPFIAEFVSKMVAERRAGRVTAAIMLTHNYTDTAWFHEAAGLADAICFTRGRVKFYDASGAIAAPTQGQAFTYFGDDIAAFATAFAGVGFVVTPFRGEVADAA